MLSSSKVFKPKKCGKISAKRRNRLVQSILHTQSTLKNKTGGIGMKVKKVIATLLCAVLLIGVLPLSAFAAGSPFTDVRTSDWFYDGVQYAYERGMMNGTGNNKFSPNQTTTRCMIVTILHRLEGTPAVNGAVFSDVADGKWYADAVRWASSKGIVNGYGNGRFGPEDTITREQMAAILYRYANYKGYDVSASISMSKYTDAGQISSYAVASMTWANAIELITGTTGTTLEPKGSATRAQVAVILMRFCLWIEQNAAEDMRVYENGDTVFIPSEENMMFDESESTIYYNNLLIVYTYTDLSWSDASALAALVNGKVVGRISGAINALQIKVPDSSLDTLNLFAEKLMSDASVMYAGYEYPIQPEETAAGSDPWSGNPNSPETDRGNERNPDGNDWWAEAICAYSAWEYADTAAPIRVGVIDSGFQTDHPDLKDTIHFPQNYTGNTAENHGTHVAGLISANHNTIGLRGTADQSTLYCVDWSPASNVNYLSTGEYVEITKQLIEKDVRIINNSWGNYFLSKDGYTRAVYGDHTGLPYLLQYLLIHISGAYDSYVEYINALSKRTALECISIMVQLMLNGHTDFLIVQAAGNGYDNCGPGVDTQKSGFYCAINESVYLMLPQETRETLAKRGITYRSIADRKVIVGAVENTRNAAGDYQMTSFSNFGSNVDLCAPGEQIFSTVTGSSYDFLSGTSMAAPIVAGSLAYSWSLAPGLSAPEVKSILLKHTSCSAYGVGNGTAYAYPMVNMKLAAEAALVAGQLQIHYYEVFDNGISSWNAAEAYCESLGGHLATLTSEEENDHVYQLMRNAGYTSAYFGLTDQAAEGTWTWVTGESVAYTNWHSGEPNHENANEDYGMFYYKYSDGTWNDGDFGGRTVNGGSAFICEWDTESAYNAYQKQTGDLAGDAASPFAQQYWVIFTEGYRNDRLEASTIDSTLPSEQLYIVWDTALVLNDTSGSGRCDQYYLDENDAWIKIGDYYRLTDKATNVLASSLDIYDKNGNLLLKKTSYADIDWDMIHSYR